MMPRSVEITVPSKDSKKLLDDIQKQISGVASVRIQKNISIKPKGDVLAIEITDKNFPQLMSLLAHKGIGSTSGTSLTTSQPLSVVSSSSNMQVLTDTNESSWEEAEQTIAKESNATPNMLMIMFTSGAIAAIGIATNALHVVIGAMVIAPAFEPILRLPLGIVTGNKTISRSFMIFLKIYGSLLLGAISATLFIAWYSKGTSFGSQASYNESFELLNYWSKVSPLSVIVSALASVAGALLVLSNRSTLTAGVMIALALVPAATLFGVGIVYLDISLMADSVIRWIVDVALVTVIGFLIFHWKRQSIHKRPMLPRGK